jgi:hypothetical protein
MPRNNMTRRKQRGGVFCFGGLCSSTKATAVEEPGKKPNNKGKINMSIYGNVGANNSKGNGNARKTRNNAMKKLGKLRDLQRRFEESERKAQDAAKALAMEMAKLAKNAGNSMNDTKKTYKETYAEQMREYHSSEGYKRLVRERNELLKRNA